MSEKFTLSVNRMFKIQERLKDEMNNNAQEYRVSTSISIRNPIPSQLQMKKLEGLRVAGPGALRGYLLASDLYLKIRKAVGDAGTQASGLLAELDQLKARELFLNGILRTISDPSVINLEDLEDYKRDLLNTKDGGALTISNSVIISLISEQERADLVESLESMRLRIFALQEDIAEANQKKVTLHVTEDEMALLHKLIGRS